MPRCTSSREPHRQIWPWLAKAARIVPSSVESRSQSAKTTVAFLPAELEAQLAEAGRGGDLPAGGRAAGEGDRADAFVGGQRGTDFGAETVDQVEGAVGQAEFVDGLRPTHSR